MGLRDGSCVAQLSFAADSNAELARLRTRLSERGWQRGESGGGESHYAKGASILVVDLGAPVTLRFPPG